MVPPTMLYINQNLIIKQISATMNYQQRLNKQLFIQYYTIDLNDLNNVDEHDIKFYTQMVRIQQDLNMKLGNYEYIQEIQETYFPDGVWNLIKSYAFNRIEYLTKLRNKLIPITWGFKDLCQFGDHGTPHFQERRLYFLYIMQQCEDIDTEIYDRQNN